MSRVRAIRLNGSVSLGPGRPPWTFEALRLARWCRPANPVLVAASASALLFLFATAAFGQMNTGEITGTVTDPVHASIPHATVTALNVETQAKFTTATSDAGEYLLAQLAPGEYTLTASAQGFQQAVQEHFALHVNDRAHEDFSLKVGDIAQAMIVQVAPGTVQAESAEVKDVVLNQQVVNLPLKNREFLQLTLLSEGVVNPPGGTRGDALQQTGSLINVLGQRTGHNLFLVDGVSVTDEYFNNVVQNPSPDEIQEFMIDKTDYDAEFGGKSGAVVNIITRAGTNQPHGSVYEFVRNNIFNARNFFDPAGQPAPPLQGNEFGAAVGGPVIKDSTFFFANYDGQRIRNTVADLFNVPTLAQRAGNFSGGPTIHYPGTSIPIPGNNLANDPTLHLDPAAVALLNMLPAPTPGLMGSSDLRSIGESSIENNQYNARLDRRFSERDSGTLRASVFDARESDPFGSSVLNESLLPGFGRDLATHSVNFAAAETHTFSSGVVNEARFGWLQVSGGQSDPNAGNPFAWQYGLQGLTANPADQGFPQVSLNGSFTNIGSPAFFISRTDRNFELSDNVLIHHGAHSIQFGGYLFHLDFNPRFPNDARGLYTYNGTYTGNALADFLLGDPSQAQGGIGEGAENAHTNWAQFYVEDGWQIKPSLRINAGLRYEYNADLVAQHNQTSSIDLSAPGGPAFVVAGDPANLPAAARALAALSPIPIVSASSVGWDSSLLTPRYLRFSPRLGVAWRMPGSRDTVVRAGFGIYTNQAAYSILQALAENMPFFLVKTVTNSASAPSSTENILAQNPNGAIGANSVNHDYRIEYNEVWNLTVQHAINANTSVEAEYIGSRTVHADSSTAVNVPQTFGGPRPYPSLAAFTTIRWDGWATFNGLTLKVTRRFARGISFDADYTLSHSIDDASDTGTTNAEYNLPQNVYAPAETASSSFDHRNRFTANVIYDLPFRGGSNRALRATLGGWRASGILTIQSGAPFTVNLPAGSDVAHIGLVNGNNIERPNLVGNPNDGPKTASEWFNTAAFALPSQNTFGTAGRNVVVGPGLEALDVSLQKEWSVRESMAVQFLVDAFNALNHPNFNLPGRIFGASNFGEITSAQDPRQLQLAAKFIF